MRCIFCKKISDTSQSIEHIVPESLGNTEHVLPKGVVCDKCNNYFAVKIERPMLELPYFVSARHRNAIENKKGRVPIEAGVLLQTSSKVNFHIEKDSKSISLEDEKAYQWIKDHQKFTIVVPVNESPPADNLIISKFIGKVAIEALAKIGLEVEGGLNDIVDNPGLDPLKDYVRYGRGVKFWPYHARPIYSEGRYFRDDRTPEGYEVLHEFQLFQTDEQMWHFVLVIFGQEYCINLAEPTVTLYQDWLKSNDNACPLYGYFNNEQF